MSKLLCIAMLGFTLTTYAQTPITITGKVMDAETKEPLAFSTISLLGTSQGAVSNFMGEFTFTLERKQKRDTLFVSMLGFEPIKKSILELDLRERWEIELEESVVMLEEVEVNEAELSALDIVNRVLINIPDNYPTTPYLLHGFTRSHKRECGKYVALYEADFDLFGQGYLKKSPERIYVKESRQSQHVPYFHSRVLRNNRNLFISMRHINDVLFRSYSLQTNSNTYVIDKYAVDDTRLIYVIKTNHSRFVSHTMYVNANDFALLKVVMEMETPTNEKWNPLLNKGPSSDSLDFKVTRISKTIQFEQTENTYHTKYMDWLVEGNLMYQNTDSAVCDWGFRFETMFDKASTQDIQKPSKQYLMNPKSKKDPPLTPYNEVFWSSYPPITAFPITAQIVEDLELEVPLIQQFKRSGK